MWSRRRHPNWQEEIVVKYMWADIVVIVVINEDKRVRVEIKNSFKLYNIIKKRGKVIDIGIAIGSHRNPQIQPLRLDCVFRGYGKWQVAMTSFKETKIVFVGQAIISF